MTASAVAPPPQPNADPAFSIWSLRLLGGCVGLIMLILAGATAAIILNLREAALKMRDRLQTSDQTHELRKSCPR